MSLEGIRNAQAIYVLKYQSECARPAKAFYNYRLFDIAVLKRLLPAMTMGLFELIVRAERSANNASLIGPCANKLASSPKVNNYAAVSIVVRGNCCCLLGARFVRCAIPFNQSLLRIYSVVPGLVRVVSMSDSPANITSTNVQTADDSGAADTPPGGALYSWSRDPIPATGGESGATLSRPVNIPARGRARPTSGGPRVPFPPLEAYEPRQPGDGVSSARIMVVPAPRTATPAAADAPRDTPTRHGPRTGTTSSGRYCSGIGRPVVRAIQFG